MRMHSVTLMMDRSVHASVCVCMLMFWNCEGVQQGSYCGNNPPAGCPPPIHTVDILPLRSVKRALFLHAVAHAVTHRQARRALTEMRRSRIPVLTYRAHCRCFSHRDVDVLVVLVSGGGHYLLSALPRSSAPPVFFFPPPRSLCFSFFFPCLSLDSAVCARESLMSLPLPPSPYVGMFVLESE